MIKKLLWKIRYVFYFWWLGRISPTDSFGWAQENWIDRADSEWLEYTPREAVVADLEYWEE